METLAFLYSAVAYEDPNPTPELRSFDELLPNSKQVGAAMGAAALSMMAIAPQAHALVKRNDTCPAVRDVQSALVQAGYNPGGLDGVFGSKTESAVIQFQRAKQISADGVVGPRTADALGLGDAENPNNPYALGRGCGGGGSSGGGGGYSTVISTNGSPLNVRSGPGSGYAVIDVVPNGRTVRIVQESGSWGQLSSGGWVSLSWLGGGGGGGGVGNGSAIVSTNGSGLYARFGPGSSYGIGASYADGARLSTTGRTSNGWVELTNGLWVSGSWLI